MSDRNLIQPDLDFIVSLKKNGGSTIKKCMQCATCSVVCTLSNEEFGFPRKQLLMAQWGLKDQLLKDPDHGCVSTAANVLKNVHAKQTPAK